jgi:hypothetical protein
MSVSIGIAQPLGRANAPAHRQMEERRYGGTASAGSPIRLPGHRAGKGTEACEGARVPKHPRPRRSGPAQSSLLALGNFSEMRFITELSVSVVTSPSERFSATSRSRRRMILPERVLGSSGTTMI